MQWDDPIHVDIHVDTPFIQYFNRNTEIRWAAEEKEESSELD